MIKIEQGESSPYVNIDSGDARMVIKGNSFTTNPHQFYSDVLEWGKTYRVKEGKKLNIEITMGYYSTSNIQLLNLLFKNLHLNNPGNVFLTFIFDEEEEEDLDETMMSLVFNTNIPVTKTFL